MISYRHLLWSLVGAVVLLVAPLPIATPAFAATITVNSALDNGPGTCASQCTLRDALAVAASGDTIQFSLPVPSTILLDASKNALRVTRNVTIQGPGATSLAVDGQQAVQVFLVSSNLQVAISGLTIQNGRTGAFGGGISTAGGTLTLTNTVISNNAGGGIDSNGGTLTVTNSTFSGNSATTSGGAIHKFVGTLTVTNSTFSGNSAPGWGGAIYSIRSTATVMNSTFSGNSATNGGGAIARTGDIGTVDLRNSIVVNSPTGGNCNGSDIRSQGNNLSDTTSCFAGTSQGDIVTPSPMLDTLMLNDPGTTPTHALLFGSPAIDGVTFNPTDCGSTVATDQRGIPRPRTLAAARCDIGAFEFETFAPTISTIDPQTTAEDTATSAIPFTVRDSQTSPDSLVVTATTSNQTIVPNANVVLGGSGANRTVTITPLANQHGTVDVTLTVGDGILTSSTTFTLTVTAVNDPPVTTVPGPQSVKQNASLHFSAGNGNLVSVFEPEAGANPIQLALTATNGTLALNGTNGLTLTSGANGSAALTFTGTQADTNIALNGLRFTPTPGFSGAASLQIVTSDQGNTGSGGPLTDTGTVAISVQPFHSPPTISGIGDQSTDQDGSTPTVPFSVGSSEVPAASLVVTATSSNQTLVPDANIQLSGSGAARAIRVTATPRQSGATTIDVKVSDGTAEAHETFTVTVLAVNAAPTAVDDAFTTRATQTLTVPAATGVLKNDTDAESSGLQAQVVALPARGTLDLKPDGGFTYTPAPSFAGSDTFTYRASDGAAQSNVATVTLVVTPAACTPRATVNVTSAVVGGRLQVTVEALPLDARTNNRLIEIRFGAFQNGKVTLNGQPIASGATHTIPPGTTRIDFTVEREQAGHATTVPLTVVDACGSWPSFVGGGAGAGF